MVASNRFRLFSTLLILLAAILAVFWFMNRAGLALPADIKGSVKFKLVYPARGEYQIDNNSYRFLAGADTLVFNISAGNQIVSLSEQPTPNSFDLEKAVQSAGQLLSQGKSYNLVTTKIGKAAVTNFYSDKDLSKISQSAILDTNGTLVTARLLSGQSWSQADWEKFLNSLRVGK